MEQIERMDVPKTKASVANKFKKLRVSETQAQTWLHLFAEKENKRAVQECGCVQDRERNFQGDSSFRANPGLSATPSKREFARQDLSSCQVSPQ